MALQKQIVRMSAQGGLDTKTDEKNVLPTNFLELENVVFTKTGAFSKRFGYSAYTKSILESSERISSGQAATTFKQELLKYSSNNLYSYAQSENKWVDKGATKFALASEESITSNGYKLLRPSHDSISNLTCYAYEKNGAATSSVEYRIIDSETGSVLCTNSIANGSSPSVFGVVGKFYILYIESGVVKFRTIQFSTPNTISSATSIATASYYAAEKIGTRVYCASAAATGVDVCYISQDSSVSSPVNISDALAYTVFSISAEQTSSVRITYGRFAAGPVKTILYSADLNYAIHSATTLVASTTVSAIGSVEDPSDTNKSQIYVAVTAAPYYLQKHTVTSAGVATSNTAFLPQASLQSRPQAYDGKVYFAVCKDSSYLAAGSPYVPYRTLFMVSEDAEFLCLYSQDAAVYLNGEGLPKLNVENDKLTFCAAEATEVQANTATPTVTVPTVIKKLSADFAQVNNYFDATLGDNLHIAGGILKMYDGKQVVEHNFLLIPEAPKFVSETAVGAVMPNGTYQYLTVYKWIDKWGQVHRSYPSVALSYTVSGGPKKPTIRVFTLPFTKKEDVEIEVYRTEAGGTIFYKLAYNFGDRITNDKTTESLTFTDTMDDATLISNETLYTEGGVLENIAADSSRYITTYKNRVILLSSDGYTLQYSKKRELNGPVEFSEALKTTLDERGGPGTCTAVLDDAFIIFKERALFALNGEGPNNLGEQDDFRDPQLLTSDCGCVDPNSVVQTPEGLMFKSEKGIYILRRGLSVEYIGAAVEAYNDLTITSATLMPDTNEVRFTTDGDKALVYDYFHKHWTTFTNINAIDSLIFENTFIYLRENGDLMAETKNQFSDNGSYIKIKIVSSWLQLAGIQGFQRFYELMLLGSYKSKHSLKVKFAYDFNPAWVQETDIAAGTLLDTSEYGTGTYGSESVYGGAFPLYQFRIFPERQKCQAIKFSIEDFKTDGNGEAFTLSNFAAEIGLKQSANKVQSSRSFGAS